MSTSADALNIDTRIIKICDRINEVLLYLVFFSIPVFFIILTRDQFELPKLTLLRILTAAMLGVWVIRIIAARRWEFRTTPLDLPILAWCVLQIATTLLSVSPYISWRGEYENFRGLLTVFNYVVLYYLMVNFIRSRAQIDRLLFTILLAGLIVTGYGVAQFFGIDFIAWNPASISPGRYFSTLGNPNFLAAYLAMVMPLLVVFFIETPSTFKRGLLLISFVLMFSALMGTWSRGGFLGLVFALAVLAAFGIYQIGRRSQNQAPQQKHSLGTRLFQAGRAHRPWLVLIGLILAILVAISATFGRNHMLRLADTIMHLPKAIQISRLHIWGPSLNIIKQHPFLGTGLDTFKTVFPRYATPDFAAIDGANVASRTAHNEILQVLATQGFIGLVIVTWLTIMILINWYKAFAQNQNRWQDRLILVGLLSSWTAYSIQNIFSFGVACIDTFYWLILAMVVLLQAGPLAQAERALSQTPDPHPGFLLARLSRIRGVVILLTLLGSGWMAWLAAKTALADYAFNRGAFYRMHRMWDQGIQAFSEAARLAPTEVKYAVYKGLAFEEKAKIVPADQQQKNIDKAILAYQDGVRMNPHNAYYLGNLGRAYGFAAHLNPTSSEYYEKAVAYFQKAIAHAPVTILFYQNLAMTYLSHGDESGFHEVLARLTAFDSQAGAKLVFNAGNHLYNFRQLVKAREFYEKAVQLDPDYVEAHFNLGVVLAQTLGPVQAIPQWQRALELKPDFGPARQMLERYKSSSTPLPGQMIIN